MGAKGTYPDWQRHLRELQAQRDEEFHKRQQEAAQKEQKERDERRAKAIRDLKAVLGFLGIEAEPTDDLWRLDDYVFYDAALRIRTLNDSTQYDWSVKVSKVKDQALLAWYEEEDRDQYTIYYEDHGAINAPSWPSYCVKTNDYRNGGEGWRREMIGLADALDQLDNMVRGLHLQWEADKKAFEERKQRAEKQAREQEKRQQEAAQQQGAPVTTSPSTLLPLEERLAATLREFILEVTRPPEW